MSLLQATVLIHEVATELSRKHILKVFPWLEECYCHFYSSVLRENKWDGEMTQWLRALAGLPDDLRLIPSTHMAVHNHFLTPIPEDLTLSSGLWGHQA